MEFMFSQATVLLWLQLGQLVYQLFFVVQKAASIPLSNSCFLYYNSYAQLTSCVWCWGIAPNAQFDLPAICLFGEFQVLSLLHVGPFGANSGDGSDHHPVDGGCCHNRGSFQPIFDVQHSAGGTFDVRAGACSIGRKFVRCGGTRITNVAWVLPAKFDEAPTSVARCAVRARVMQSFSAYSFLDWHFWFHLSFLVLLRSGIKTNVDAFRPQFLCGY